MPSAISTWAARSGARASRCTGTGEQRRRPPRCRRRPRRPLGHAAAGRARAAGRGRARCARRYAAAAAARSPRQPAQLTDLVVALCHRGQDVDVGQVDADPGGLGLGARPVARRSRSTCAAVHPADAREHAPRGRQRREPVGGRRHPAHGTSDVRHFVAGRHHVAVRCCRPSPGSAGPRAPRPSPRRAARHARGDPALPDQHPPLARSSRPQTDRAHRSRRPRSATCAGRRPITPAGSGPSSTPSTSAR